MKQILIKHEIMINVENQILVVMCECGYTYKMFGQVGWTALEQIVSDHLEAQ